MGEYSKGKDTRNRALAVYKSVALRSVNSRIAISKDLSISNVLFVESLSFNLISIAQLCDLGLMCTFDKNGVVVTLEGDKIYQSYIQIHHMKCLHSF